MSEVIVITSGKGGVGKTTTTANIGGALAGLGFKTLLIDTDIGLRNLDVVMGLENRIVYNIVDVVEGSCKAKQAIIKDKTFPNLALLPAAQTRDKTSIAPEQMKKLIDDLKPEYDYIIIDCPAGIEHGFKNAIAAAERAVVVTTPEVSAIRDADRIIGILNSCEMPRIDLVINKIRMSMVRRGDMMSVDDVVDILSINLIGTIMDDESIVISTNRGEMIAGNRTKPGKAYIEIAKRIAGEALEDEAYDYSFSILKLLKKKDKNVHKVSSQGL
ncbi:MAG: septum site-determining protein MinD [Lachnospiraceae bacterium]|nr:septum site-determining protein MinD [Lachnospiraceae bacterium]